MEKKDNKNCVGGLLRGHKKLKPVTRAKKGG